jgi:hypothetical protein
MAELPRIKNLKAEPPYTLHITWQKRGSDRVDMVGVVSRFSPFAPLRDETAFAKVALVDFGTGVEWPGGLDMSAASLWRLAQEQRAMTGADFVRWQKAHALSNQEAADLLGVALSTVKGYRRRKRPLPKAVQIACRAMDADPTAFYAHFSSRKPGRPGIHRAA